MNNSRISAWSRKGHLFAGAGIAALMLVSSPAVAQDASDDSNSDAAAQDSAARDNGSAIIVTGSRIQRPELVGLEPTVSIGETYLTDRNLTNIADALNELPQFRGSVTPNGAQSGYGSGVNFINTYGLGSNRTLTLIDGKRAVSSNLPSLFGPGSPGTQVDLNIIPSILIKRIDSVTIGGAPVYGSDAIAGTVNIILDDNYSGFKAQATSGLSDRGDNFRYNVSALGGMDFLDGRGHLTLAASYDSVKGVRGVDRKHIRDNLGYLNNCTSGTPDPDDGRVNPNIGCNTSTSDGIPARVLSKNLTSPYLASGGVVFDATGGGLGATGLQFDSNGNLIPVAPGSRLTGFFQSGGNTYQTSDQTQVTSDVRRFSAYAASTYELSSAATIYATGLYYNAETHEQGSNPTFNTWVFDPDTSGGLTFDVATTPFLNDNARAELLGLGVETLNLSRSNEDLFDNGALTKTELKRGVVGVRGDLGRSLNYDVSFNYGTVEIQNISQEINQQRFINAVSVEQGPNGAVCTINPTVPVAPDQPVQPTADPNCQPLNLLGYGVASAAGLNYIRETVNNPASLDQWVVNANVGGNLFDTWAGPIGFNVGYEHRNEKAAFNTSSFTQNGGGRSSAVAPTAGSYNLDEVFGEVLVPLVSPANDFPVISSAEVFGRVRYVDNTVNGGFTAFAAGGKVGLFDTLQFRGNFTRSFRAPSITELYLPQSPTFERPSDLCTASAINAGPSPDIRKRNCTAFLQATNNDPATYTLLASQASVAGISGGNPSLANEQADSYTFGVVFQPKFIPGLTATADYVNIKIKDPIANLTTAQIASGCFDNPDFDTSNPTQGNNFCKQLGFGSDGQIPNTPTDPAVRSGFVNGQSTEFEGITGVLDYRTRLFNLPGVFGLGANALYVMYRLVDNTGIAPIRSDGLLGDPKFSAQGKVSYDSDSWGFATFVNFTGKQLASQTNRGPSPNDTREFDSYSAFATVDANIYFKTADNFRFNVSVTNIGDRIGQSYYGYIIPASVSDDIGRRISVGITKEF
jgi:outer membrane receptor protein involved in Fe transport